jgi:hypothetical protein
MGEGPGTRPSKFRQFHTRFTVVSSNPVENLDLFTLGRRIHTHTF